MSLFGYSPSSLSGLLDYLSNSHFPVSYIFSVLMIFFLNSYLNDKSFFKEFYFFGKDIMAIYFSFFLSLFLYVSFFLFSNIIIIMVLNNLNFYDFIFAFEVFLKPIIFQIFYLLIFGFLYFIFILRFDKFIGLLFILLVSLISTALIKDIKPFEFSPLLPHYNIGNFYNYFWLIPTQFLIYSLFLIFSLHKYRVKIMYI